MADSTINIIISGQQGGGSEADPEVPGATPNPEAPEKNKKGGKEKDNMGSVAKAAAITAAKQAFSTVISRVGVATRSDVKQQKVNAAVKLGGYGVAVITSLATQNYAALATTVISICAEAITNEIDYNRNRNIESTALNIQRQRTGSYNRSR